MHCRRAHIYILINRNGSINTLKPTHAHTRTHTTQVCCLQIDLCLITQGCGKYKWILLNRTSITFYKYVFNLLWSIAKKIWLHIHKQSEAKHIKRCSKFFIYNLKRKEEEYNHPCICSIAKWQLGTDKNTKLHSDFFLYTVLWLEFFFYPKSNFSYSTDIP